MRGGTLICQSSGSKAGPVVSMNTNDFSTLYVSASGTSYARLRLNSNGNEETNSDASNATINSTVRGAWLDTGTASDVWVERTVVGTLDLDDPGAGRLNLGTSRTYGITYTAPPIGSDAATVTFDFYDAATGGTLLQTNTITITAEINNA